MKRYAPDLTLFSDQVIADDGFVTKAILNQSPMVSPYVCLEFFLHRPPPAILELLMKARKRGWWLDYMYRPTCLEMTERWFVRQSGTDDFNAEWEFAQSILRHPDRVIDRDHLAVVSPHLYP